MHLKARVWPKSVPHPEDPLSVSYFVGLQPLATELGDRVVVDLETLMETLPSELCDSVSWATGWWWIWRPS